MATRVGINGFGRIGRQVLRAIMERHAGKLEVVSVNDNSDAKTNAHLFKYDSTYGRYPGTVEVTGASIVIDGNEIRASSERDPSNLSWGDEGVDLVIECTGALHQCGQVGGASRIRSEEGYHLRSGQWRGYYARPGSERTSLRPAVAQHYLQCILHHELHAPMAKVLNDSFGVEQGLMTAIHAYTNDQRMLDGGHSDLRRARAGAVNIIPTSTGGPRLSALCCLS